MAVMRAITDRRLQQRVASLTEWTPEKAFARVFAAWPLADIAEAEAMKAKRRELAEHYRKRGA